MCLICEFDPPHRIYYLAEEILPGVGILGGEPRLLPVTEHLSWLEETP